MEDSDRLGPLEGNGIGVSGIVSVLFDSESDKSSVQFIEPRFLLTLLSLDLGRSGDCDDLVTAFFIAK
jgi:hypothetical protein